jgi:hypothetical protein
MKSFIILKVRIVQIIELCEPFWLVFVINAHIMYLLIYDVRHIATYQQLVIIFNNVRQYTLR